MGKRGTFDIVDGGQENTDQSGDEEFKVSCSTTRLVLAVIVSVAIITCTGLLAFYIPDRTCPVNEFTTAIQPPDVTTPPPPLVTTTPGSPTGPITTTEAPWNGRLPHAVWPLRYELFLTPYLYQDDVEEGGPGYGRERFNFDGEVNIRVKCQEVTNMITMHMLDLTVHNVSVVRMTDENSEELVKDWKIDTYYQFLNIETVNVLIEGEDYEVRISYHGVLTDLLVGFYRSSYVNDFGELKWLAATQMQSIDARRALPCFDEPDFKAVFDTTIRHRADMVAISNGIEIMVKDWDGVPNWKETVYKRTPRMSTYLLAFVVCDFTYTHTTTPNGVLFRAWSRPEAINTTLYALESGDKMLTYYEEYFDYAFPLAKQDMVAIPDFQAGAMENWGCILYRETAMLYDPMENSASNKQRVADVVAHELAHMWFGDLVTPIWWGEFWLNEGFAVYTEYIGVRETEPTWEVESRFGVNEVQYAFSVDALGSSHPIRIPVNSPSDLDELTWASLPYNKGSSLIRMLNEMLSSEVFLRGLNDYLKLHAFDTIYSDDLWAAMTYADKYYGKRDVKKIMDTWTLNMGYPLVSFDRMDTTTVNVSQKHFLIDPDSPVEDKYGDIGYIWEIEISHTHASERQYDTPKKDFVEREKSSNQYIKCIILLSCTMYTYSAKRQLTDAR